jgi:aldehyde dehydrogenase (NAD+)
MAATQAIIDTSIRVQQLRWQFDQGVTKTIPWREQQLRALRRMLTERQTEFYEAVQHDLGRCHFESLVAEYGPVKLEIEFALKNLRAWAKPSKITGPLIAQPCKSSIVYEPRGVVLILGPWNYPISLVLMPLIAALAAGNCVVIKPSELTPHASSALAKYLPQYLDPNCIAVVEGGIDAAQDLLKQRFDSILYTGGETAAHAVLHAAAEYLTPVTLELGGKSPCIIDADADLEVCVRRVAWGKFFNAGQTCLAPDYVLVHQVIEKQFLAKFKKVVERFYGHDPKASPDFGRIVNARHHQRLMRLLSDQNVFLGGESNSDELYLAPTVVHPVSLDAPIMTEEIFGPLLPVIPVASIDAAIAFVNARPKPLALYMFSKNAQTQQRVVDGTSSGGVCINDTMYHYADPNLPFGGVGPSGMGVYRGRFGFETFSHKKAVMHKATWIDPFFRYPPYTTNKRRWLQWLFG